MKENTYTSSSSEYEEIVLENPDGTVAHHTHKATQEISDSEYRRLEDLINLRSSGESEED